MSSDSSSTMPSANSQSISSARQPTPHTTWIAFTLTVVLFSIVAALTLNPPRHLMRKLHRHAPKPILTIAAKIPFSRYLVEPPSDLAIAIRSFSDYSFAQQKIANGRYAAWEKMSAKHRLLGRKLDWKTKLEQIEDAIEDNAKLTDELATIGMEVANKTGELVGLRSMFARQDGRVIEVLKHFVRDWSDEGKRERDALFPPILDALKAEFHQQRDSDEPLKALVPGSGLCRLAYEISELGFATDANDYSHFMNIGAKLVFTRTVKPHQYRVKPWIHNLSHQRSTANTLRINTFPDIVPNTSASLKFVPGNFLDIEGLARFDAVVTMFFIDTAKNLCDYFETIWRLLKPGGIWINEGPLLYYGQPGMALPLDDVIKLAELIGFKIEQRKTLNNVSYTADSQGMYNFLYDCEFWIARKPSQ
ncbi:hypothetical protein OIO90_002343 [Microbotryomycetes sp. JL221]|nr:hypothetical protein OIO90_002343 [Microbotryomycetes sp. JL221]